MNSGGILSGRQILDSIRTGDIRISPFDWDNPSHVSRVNPASYDLTLGSEVAVYTETTYPDFSCTRFYSNMEAGKEITGIPGERIRPRYIDEDTRTPSQSFMTRRGCLDSAKENEVARYTMEKTGFVLMPGIGYLMHTAERISTDKYVPILDGKSSIGRLFCFVHVTAGYGDPGFDGQYTLEVAVLQPLIVYPGMKFCQIRFHTIIGEVNSYKEKGNYNGVLAEGPVPSRSWKMFDEQKT